MSSRVQMCNPAEAPLGCSHWLSQLSGQVQRGRHLPKPLGEFVGGWRRTKGAHLCGWATPMAQGLDLWSPTS